MGRKGEGNRQRIIEAADGLFYRRGYNQTSFQDISEATGIPRGNFYYYFKTKEDILSAVVDSRIAEMNTMLAQCESESDDARERLMLLTDILDRNREDILKSGCPIGTLSSELAKDDPALHDKARQAFSLMRDWFKTQFESLGVSSADELSMDLLARLQGASVVACTFKDDDYISRSHQEIKDWINAKTLN